MDFPTLAPLIRRPRPRSDARELAATNTATATESAHESAQGENAATESSAADDTATEEAAADECAATTVAVEEAGGADGDPTCGHESQVIEYEMEGPNGIVTAVTALIVSVPVADGFTTAVLSAQSADADNADYAEGLRTMVDEFQVTE
ncbi:hypothetical protein FOB82_06275 [Corynebacterium xerosis]|uniref:Uncharacterized protein n=1 Tax=Corynebacterium xerosis TaxID=1725 RepID=A0A6B8TG85_9CORY|nr:hypothetical protein [Corynebacterium xerosis]QGS34614.1 hypothetical protein FOB82_06275 [Corynebacterium xerosis]